MSIDVTDKPVHDRQTHVSPYELAGLLGAFPPTEEQARIISSPLEPLLVIAGAGSGKTTTMADRVVWLVANGYVLPEEILGVTFTRKAAGELAGRIRRQLAKLTALARSGKGALALGSVAAEALEPKVSTYHSYASGIVTDYGLRLGIERDAVVLGGAESWQLASHVVEAYDGGYEHFSAAKSTLVKAVLDLAGECSEHLQDPLHVRATVEALAEQLAALPYLEGKVRASTKGAADLVDVLRTRGSVAEMVVRYTVAKRNRNALDYGDLVALAAQIADQVPQAAELERQRYKVVLLDEFQDTSHAQLQLFAKLFGDGHPVTAVGDPHQSIYGFRGASAGQLFRFPEIFRTSTGGFAATAELTTAWRNSINILNAANVMSGELNAVQRRKSAQRRNAGPAVTVSPLRQKDDAAAGTVLLARYATVVDEADAVAASILSQKDFRAERDAGAGRRLVSSALEPTTVGILCRRRAQFLALQSALEARGIPYEIVGLGGLLETPEIVDLVATLRVLADPGRSDSLMRLLTGARWRVGPLDLMALADWSRYLARQREYAADVREEPDADAAASGLVTDRSGEHVPRPAADTAVELDLVDGSSLVEGLDQLKRDYWPAGLVRTLTPAGLERLLALRDELRYLRSFVGDDLTSLLGEVERTMLLDIELAAKPNSNIHHARRNLDAFADAAADFMQTADRVDLLAFLGWLETAESEENGLEMTQPEVNPDAVQLLTVHASKGLEWDVVYVPGLNEGAFPSGRVNRWSQGAASLPWPLRGDSEDLPEWDLSMPDQKGWLDTEKLYAEDVKAHGEEEERRLAYVAFTRAKNFLMCSSTAWSAGRAKPTAASIFLTELLPLTELTPRQAVLGDWFPEGEPGEGNPLTAGIESAQWPYDPLEGPRITGRQVSGQKKTGRRNAVEASARAVYAELARLAQRGQNQSPASIAADADFLSLNPRWGKETSLLLAQRGLQSRTAPVQMPAHISASLLVDLGDDPAAVTRNLRRPVPRKPGMAARKGTAFHAWVEEYFGTSGQLDLDEVPGADSYVDEAYGLELMQATFRASHWAQRTPEMLEVPVETRVGDVVVRGRIDAVFRDADGAWDLIDWKTGRVPSAAALSVRSVQLAVYRLAWSRLKGVELRDVRAAFYFVGQDKLIRPHNLAGEVELERIVSSAYSAGASGAVEEPGTVDRRDASA
ncbi:ATP-dependent helicase [Arthrobacter sp. H14-L1]|uniref:ATP-dependent helicase n=1 Tax=Arthrobacter sp. H14-L1 TaxID=2996697 RepID=UPI00226DC0A9|nr:ATP-dependent DNA helicase [Arthrobacter sp. H14-L1]MCY0903498.1 ATP-dependent DNA helicase [Arthrobacter sp. H14-L1]